MPVHYPPTALTSVQIAAAQALTYKPILLAQFNLTDGITVIYAATDVVTYSSIVYQPIIQSIVLNRVQQRTPIGVDVFPGATITIADPSATIFQAYELNPSMVGFKGAIVTLTLILIDKITGAVSTNSIVKMTGRCDPPSINDKTMVITIKSKLDLSRTFVPNVPISKLCPYPFPGNAAQQATVGDWFSIYYPCGYPGGTGFTDCNYDIPSCAARGMLALGRPGWLQFEPPAAWSNPHVYTSGSRATGWNTDNQAKYQSYVPLSYGTALVQGIVANVEGDGNDARFEVVVGWGDMEASGMNGEPKLGSGGILMVIVNNVVVPHVGGVPPQPVLDPYFPEPYSGPIPFDSTFCWQYVNNGSRNGNTAIIGQRNGKGPIVNTNRIPGYDSLITVGGVQYASADPYGSMMVIVVVVPLTVQSNTNAPPDVLVITTNGKKVRVYNGPSTYNSPDPQYSEAQPIWTIIDMLVTCGAFQYTDFDMQTAVDAQTVCGTLIPFTGVAGPYATGVQVATDGVTLTISGTTAGGTFLTGGAFDFVYMGQLVQVVPGTWQSGITYSTGNYVSWNGSMYVAIAGSTGAQPDVSPSDWTLSLTDDGINCRISSITNATQIILDSPGVGTAAFIGAGGQDSTAKLLISHQRYRLNLILQNRQAVSDLLTGIKLGCNLNLVPNNVTNQLQFFIDQGLGDQQPAPITGSNDNSAYASYLATNINSGDGTGGAVNYGYDGTHGIGYVAFNFNDDNIILEGNDGNYTSSLQISQLPAASTPNRIITPFQNEEILNESDTSTRIDTDDYARMGQSYDATVQMVGVPNFDQLFRQANNYMARLYRGNPRSAASYGDTGGTIIVMLKTPGMQVAHLRVGHIVSLTSARFGLSKQVFRVQSLEADNNFNIMTVTMGWHDDRWFLDSYGNGPAPAFATSTSSLNQGPPLGWIAYDGAQPLTGDEVYTSPQYWQPGIIIKYQANADLSISALARSFGRYPVNHAAADTSTPYISLQGTVDVSTGTVPSGVYFIAIVALDANGNVTFPQLNNQMCQVTLSAGSSTGSLIVPRILWSAGAAAGAFFVGYNAQHMQFQGYITPATVSTVNVDATGLIISQTAGSTFSALRVGDLIVVNGNGVSVKTISSSTSLTINTAITGPQTGVILTGPLQNNLTISNLTGAANPAVKAFPLPDSRFDHVQVQQKVVRHAGPVGAAITGVTTNHVSIAGAGFSTNQWSGYYMSIVAFSNLQNPIPVFNALINSNTSTTFDLTLDPLANGVTSGSVMTIYSYSTVSVDVNGNTVLTDPNWVNPLGPEGDPFTISAAVYTTMGPWVMQITTTLANSFVSGNSITVENLGGYSEAEGTWVITVIDAFNFSYTVGGLHHSLGPYTGGGTCFTISGLGINAEVGNLIRFLNTDGTSYTAAIGSNTATSVTTAAPMQTQPLDGCNFIIEEPDWHTTGQSTQSIALTDPLAITDIDVLITNYEDETILVQNLMCSVDGQFSTTNTSPIRMVYVYGQASINNVIASTAGYYTITPSGGTAIIDLSNGAYQRLVLNGTAVEIPSVIYTGGSIVAGLPLTLYLDQDSTGGRDMPTFDTATTATAGTFASDVPATQIDPSPGTRTTMVFSSHPGPVWCLTSAPRTGGAIL